MVGTGEGQELEVLPEGPGYRDADVSFAVFYDGGEALHAGPVDTSSHGCVHVDWDSEDLRKQINYHSVAGLTRVTVRYSAKPWPARVTAS